MRKNAILIFSCPDKKGIVATVANFIFQYNGNIVHADEHLDVDSNLFFMRVEWDMTDFDINANEIEKYLKPVIDKFKMNWRLVFADYLPKIAIFVSKDNHCLADLLYKQQNNELKCQISLIISNHQIAKKLADFYKIPFYKITSDNKKDAENKIVKLLNKHQIDLIVLARYMQILSKDFVDRYPNRIINIHHSFLPAFVGSKPYHQAYDRGVKIIGATSHYVTATLDQGPIIEQDVVRITHRHNVGRLIQTGNDLEKIVLSRAVRWHLENRILVYNNKTIIFGS